MRVKPFVFNSSVFYGLTLSLETFQTSLSFVDTGATFFDDVQSLFSRNCRSKLTLPDGSGSFRNSFGFVKSAGVILWVLQVPSFHLFLIRLAFKSLTVFFLTVHSWHSLSRRLDLVLPSTRLSRDILSEHSF